MLEMVRFSQALHDQHVPPITRILHAAYAPLAAQGMHYLASHQPPSKTLERLLEGFAWLIFWNGKLAGTVSLYEGRTKKIRAPYYEGDGVWLFGQFAIEPALQRGGIGSRVMDFLESEAARLGAAELALDTSENAARLI